MDLPHSELGMTCVYSLFALGGLISGIKSDSPT